MAFKLLSLERGNNFLLNYHQEKCAVGLKVSEPLVTISTTDAYLSPG